MKVKYIMVAADDARAFNTLCNKADSEGYEPVSGAFMGVRNEQGSPKSIFCQQWVLDDDQEDKGDPEELLP